MLFSHLKLGAVMKNLSDEKRSTIGKRQFLGQPAGVLLLVAVEVWERFSYYGMRAILVLFLVSSTRTDGFGWTEPEAIRLYGYYLAAVWLTPVFGGWIADRFIGLKRALVIGGVIMALGHFCMGGAGYVPSLIAAITGLPVDHVLANSGLILGKLWLDPAMRSGMEATIATLGVEYDHQNLMTWSTLAYFIASISFYSALILIIIGNGLFKAPVATMVGLFYPKAGPDKDAGYTLYYMSINVGAFLAPLVVGFIGEIYGWHLGFTLAGIGMLFGLALLIWKQKLLPEAEGNHVSPSDMSGLNADRELSLRDWDRVIALIFLVLLATLFQVVYEQQGSLINIFAYRETDRWLAGFEIPATWFQSLNPLLVIVAAPVIAWLWVKLDNIGRLPSLPIKFAIGLLLLSAAWVCMIIGAAGLGVDTQAKASMTWLVLWFVFITAGELIAFPLYFSALSSLAPIPYRAMTMGAGYIALSAGSFLASRVGAQIVEQGYIEGFTFMAVMAFGFALLPVVMNKTVKRWMHLNS